MLIIDKNHIIESISDNGLVLLQKDRDQLIGRKCYEAVHGQDCPPTFCPLLDVNGGALSSAFAARSAELAAHPLSIRCMALRDEDGAVLKVLGITEESPQTPVISAMIRESELRLNEVLDSVPHAILLADPVGVITRANREAGETLGARCADLQNRSIYEFISPQERQAFQLVWQKTFTESGPHLSEQNFVKTDGTTFRGSFNANVLKDSQGNTIGVILGVRNISYWRQMQESLRFSNTVIKSIRESVIAWDNDDCIVYWNEASKHIYGLSAGEAIGKKLHDIFDRMQPYENGDIERLDTPAFSPEEGGDFLLRARGRPVLARGSVVPIEHGGRRQGWVAVATDITERQEMAQRISVMDAAVASSISATVMIDSEGKLTYVNDAFLKLWGYASRDEAMGISVGSLWQPGNMRAEIMQRLSASEGWSGELTGVRKDGTTFDVQVASSMVKGKWQQPLCAMATFTDITEAKKSRLALQESRAFISSLLDNSHHPTLVINPDTSIRYVNPALEKLTGFTSADLAGRKAPYPWAVQDSMPRTAKEFRIAMSRGPKWFEELYRKKNGKHFWVEVSSAPVTQNGTLSYYMLSWVDITDRRLIEEELTKERDRQKTYLDTVGVMVATVDSHGKITMVNRKACETLGFTEKELMGQNWYTALIPPRNRGEVRKTFRTLLTQSSHNGAKHNEGVLVTRTGEEKLFTFTHTLLRVPGKKSAQILISGEDTTELRKTQEQLGHSHLLASLGEMTAGIAHEVNNPLGSILLYSELLMATDVPPQVKKDLKVIHDEAKRATTVMTDLLIYGRRTKPQVRRMNLNSVVKKVLDMRRYQHKVQNITVSTDLAEGPLFVKGDASQLMQVVMNIVLNAEDALREHKGGSVKVTTRSDSHWVRLTITDDGPGIPEEYINQIFYPFFTTKPVGEGTGLGLSICYGIVTAHNGLVRAQSNKGGGATFTVELPLGNGKNGNGHHPVPPPRK